MRRATPIFVLLLLLLGAARPARAQEDVGEMYNPFLAEKNLEVGEFYLKKKNYDAAIERLLEAIRHKANFAKPHRLLGIAFEKKGELDDAILYYEKYLEILPQAEDAGKIRKRIEKLRRKIEERKKRKRRSG
jgi:tetratricopeptide (TPR) repeat protein